MEKKLFSSLANKTSRIANKVYVKHIVPKIEKTYESGGEKVKYLFYPKDGSDVLIVGFQAYSADGPRYNYIVTLTGEEANRLYIKDDFIPTGDYYLGRNKKFNIEQAVFNLINEHIKAYHIKTLIFIRSSKGGYAALNFGLSYPGSNIIVAAPQYYLGSYMKKATKFHPALHDILGTEFSNEDIRSLDERLPKKVINAKGNRVYIHCSVNEGTYETSVSHILSDFKRTNCAVFFDRGEYANHGDLKLYFPEYLRAVVNELLANEKNGEIAGVE